MKIETFMIIAYCSIPISIALSIFIATIIYNLNYLIKTIKEKSSQTAQKENYTQKDE